MVVWSEHLSCISSTPIFKAFDKDHFLYLFPCRSIVMFPVFESFQIGFSERAGLDFVYLKLAYPFPARYVKHACRSPRGWCLLFQRCFISGTIRRGLELFPWRFHCILLYLKRFCFVPNHVTLRFYRKCITFLFGWVILLQLLYFGDDDGWWFWVLLWETRIF